MADGGDAHPYGGPDFVAFHDLNPMACEFFPSHSHVEARDGLYPEHPDLLWDHSSWSHNSYFGMHGTLLSTTPPPVPSSWCPAPPVTDAAAPRGLQALRRMEAQAAARLQRWWRRLRTRRSHCVPKAEPSSRQRRQQGQAPAGMPSRASSKGQAARSKSVGRSLTKKPWDPGAEAEPKSRAWHQAEESRSWQSEGWSWTASGRSADRWKEPRSGSSTPSSTKPSSVEAGKKWVPMEGATLMEFGGRSSTKPSSLEAGKKWVPKAGKPAPRNVVQGTQDTSRQSPTSDPELQCVPSVLSQAPRSGSSQRQSISPAPATSPVRQVWVPKRVAAEKESRDTPASGSMLSPATARSSSQVPSREGTVDYYDELNNAVREKSPQLLASSQGSTLPTPQAVGAARRQPTHQELADFGGGRSISGHSWWDSHAGDRSNRSFSRRGSDRQTPQAAPGDAISPRPRSTSRGRRRPVSYYSQTFALQPRALSPPTVPVGAQPLHGARDSSLGATAKRPGTPRRASRTEPQSLGPSASVWRHTGHWHEREPTVSLHI